MPFELFTSFAVILLVDNSHQHFSLLPVLLRSVGRAVVRANGRGEEPALRRLIRRSSFAVALADINKQVRSLAHIKA